MNIETKVQEILTKHGLDFTIEKLPMQMVHPTLGNLPTGYYGLMNSKTHEAINTAKVGYTVSQNAEIVEAVLRGSEKYGSKLNVVKAGSINDGRKVYIQMEVEGTAKVGDDILKKYVTIIDSNDGSTGLSVGIGDLNMWCTNQFFKFYKAGNAKFRHTSTITEKIAKIPQLIEISLAESLKQIKVYNKFLSTPLTQELANKMVNRVLGFDRSISPAEYAKLRGRSINNMDTLYSNIDTEVKHSGNNLWSLFGGVTRYTTHEITAPKRDNGRAETLLIGGGYKKNDAAFKFCEALV